MRCLWPLLIFVSSGTDLAYYKFWQTYSQAFFDFSLHDNHAVNGQSLTTTTDDTVPTANGAYFNTLRSVIQLPSNDFQHSAIALGLGFSLSAWVWPSADSGTIADKSQLALGTTNFRWALTAGVHSFRIAVAGTAAAVQSPNTTPTAAWSLLTVSVDCSTTTYCAIVLYENAVTAQSTAASGTLSEDEGLVLLGGSALTAVSCFRGVMYEFRWTVGALLPAEVGKLFGPLGSAGCAGCGGVCALQPFSCLPALAAGYAPGTGLACDASCQGTCLSPGASGCYAMSALVCNINCSTCYRSQPTWCLTCSALHALPNASTHLCECVGGFYASATSPISCAGTADNCQIEKESTSSSTDPCNPGFYASASDCLKCKAECDTCSDGSTCDQCYGGASLNASGLCVCAGGLYLDTLGKACAGCSQECDTCVAPSYLSCLTCYDAAKLSSASGVGSCKCSNGFFLDTLNRKCAACDSHCAQCFGSLATNCLSCSGGASLAGDSSCRCRPGYYWDSSCKPCKASCEACNDGETCASCYSTATLTALLACQCSTGSFLNTKKRLCQACHATCQTCSGELSTNCESCFSGVTLESGACKCPLASSFLNIVAKTCSSCASDCATCYGGSNSNCLTCRDAGAQLNTGTDSCVCKDGFYASASNPLTCSPCVVAATICSACPTNSGLATGSPGACVCNSGFVGTPPTCHQCIGFSDPTPGCPVCPDGQFDSSGVCAPCSSPCGTCKAAATQCLTCETGFYLSGTTCLPCAVGCSECVAGDEWHCTACYSEYAEILLDESQPTRDLDDHSSLDIGKCTCSYENMYMDAEGTCQWCDSQCAACVGGTAEDCVDCYDGENSHVEVTNLSSSPPSGHCACEIGFFYSEGEGYWCAPCSSECSTCIDFDSGSCLSCTDPNASVAVASAGPPAARRTQSAGECVCNAGFFSGGEGCESCDGQCKTCVGAGTDQCLSCSGSAEVASAGEAGEGQCTCSPGSFYGIGESSYDCQPCANTCETCDGPNTSSCLSCHQYASLEVNPGSSGAARHLQSSACICDNGYYQDAETGSCQPCAPECYTCIGPNNNQCTQCFDESAFVEYEDEGSGHCACSDRYFYGLTEGYGCVECDWSCGTCVGAGAADCLTCSDENASVVVPESSAPVRSLSAALTVGECTCDPGYFLGEGCNLCDSQCATCTSSNYDSCLTCFDTASVLTPLGEGGEGVCECPSGFYYGTDESGVYRCLSCDSTCETCVDSSASSCLSCKSNASVSSNREVGRALQSGDCQCDAGYYTLTDASDCKPCASECPTCSDGTSASCTSCYGSAYIAGGAGSGDCKCHCGFFYDFITDFDCASCHPDCKDCSGASDTECTACRANADLAGGSCVCGGGYYPDRSATPTVCSPCAPSCKTCSAAGVSACTDCFAHSSLSATSCVCDTGYTESPDAGNCVQCAATCGTCNSASLGVCESCKPHATLAAGVCTCDSSYLWEPSSSSCERCPALCTVCSSVATCDSCTAHATSAGGVCTCDSGFYRNAGTDTCDTCHITCVTCSGPASSDCTSCKPNSVLPLSPSPGPCTCLPHYYQNSATGNCDSCDPSCQLCGGAGPKMCTACFANAGLVTSPVGECQCGPGTVTGAPASNCLQCHPTCQTCTGTTASSCSLCKAHAALSPTNECQCVSPYFGAPDPSNCVICDSSCQTCSAGGATSCTGCYPGLYLTGSSACVSCPPQCTQCTSPTACSSCLDPHAAAPLCTCVAGYYPASSTSCQQCDPTCLSCSSGGSSSCVFCHPNAVNTLGTCVCPSAGYYGTPQSCSHCAATCHTCSGPAASQCLSCFPPAAISTTHPSECECPTGFYPNPSATTCGVCSGACQACSGPANTDCLSCTLNAVLAAGSPGPCQCSSGYYLASVFNCVICPAQCATCSSATVCSACADLHASGPSCTCDPGYFPSSPSTCQVCDITCKTCASASPLSCNFCFTNAVLTSGACVCPAVGFAGPPQNCVPCASTCASCTGPAANQCTKCATNAGVSVIHPGECECLSGFFPSPTAANCLVCHPSCASCSGSSSLSCESCPSNSQLSGTAPSSCQCLPGFTVVGKVSTCVPCNVECLTCAAGSQTICASCKAGGELTSTLPVTCKCASGFYANPTAANCSICPGLCGSCTTAAPTYCLTCKANSLSDGAGGCTCASGFVLSPDGSQCQACHYSCSTCVDGSAIGCLSCPPKSGLMTSAPSSCHCIAGYYRDSVTNSCVPASAACTRCSVSGTCRECADNAGLPFGSKSCQCVPGFFPNPTAENCTPCAAVCNTCVSWSSSSCMSCKPGAELVSTAPSGCRCSDGFFPNTDAARCEPCQDGCLKCSMSDTCEQCREGFFIENQKCVSCSAHCTSCANSSTCGSCTAGWTLSESGYCKQCIDCDLPLTAAAIGPFGYQYNVTFSRLVLKEFQKEDLALSTEPASSIDWRVVQSRNLTIEVVGGPWDNSTVIAINFTTVVRDEFGYELVTKTLSVPPPLPPVNVTTTSPNATVLYNTTLASATASTTAAIGGTVIVAGASSGGGSLAMSLLSQMQYFSYIGTANYTMTGDMNSFYTSLNQKSTLPNIYGKSRGVNAQSTKRRLSGDGMDIIDPDDFLDNCGQFLTILTALIALHLFAFSLNRLLGKRYGALRKLYQQFRYTVYLYFWYFAYLDVHVAAILQLKNTGLSPDTNRAVVCTVLALATIVMTCVTPVVIMWFIHARASLLFSLSDNLTKTHFGALVSSIRSDLSRAKFLYPVYYFQRLLYGFLIVYLRGMQLYQAIALVCPCALMMAFVLVARPMLTKPMRVLHILAEVDVVVVFVLLCFVTLNYDTPRIDICWLIVGFTLKSFLCTLLIVVIGFVQSMKERCSRRKRLATVHPNSNFTQVEDLKITTIQTEEKEISFSEAFTSVKRIPMRKVQPGETERASETRHSDLEEREL